jgi:hypothetical protein
MYCWNIDEVKVFDIMTVEVNMNSTTILGSGVHYNQPFKFRAHALQHGWYVEIESSGGRRGPYQGATFNLALEVAAAARRIL